MGLPEPCKKCQSFGGNFQYTRGGLTRCDCARGQSLRDMDEARHQPPLRDVEPKISPEAATTCISMLSAIRWFPAEPAARMIVADELQSMCNDDSEAFWLVKRMARLFAEWPGIPTLRQVFCERFIPLDRCQPIGVCEAYPDGIPPEIEVVQTPMLALPPGTVASIEQVTMPKAYPTLTKPPIVFNPNFMPITQADIDQAVNELRDKKAREQLGDGSSTD